MLDVIQRHSEAVSVPRELIGYINGYKPITIFSYIQPTPFFPKCICCKLVCALSLRRYGNSSFCHLGLCQSHVKLKLHLLHLLTLDISYLLPWLTLKISYLLTLRSQMKKNRSFLISKDKMYILLRSSVAWKMWEYPHVTTGALRHQKTHPQPCRKCVAKPGTEPRCIKTQFNAFTAKAPALFHSWKDKAGILICCNADIVNVRLLLTLDQE